ncbi:hypothetical protein Pla175_27770 [Pirellulimonas nuda]|uniref:Uncharacterized protein n=1 Tax=Pirellulimonas nuda TaxID=2528009 RepID=A0A518DD26_9BACT|nr:hypothetical protein [Pirellulimonas nuda]QDU89387.1 hypothetical protein Pla175_27770 [Pirellulimonas nuda]
MTTHATQTISGLPLPAELRPIEAALEAQGDQRLARLREIAAPVDAAGQPAAVDRLLKLLGSFAPRDPVEVGSRAGELADRASRLTPPGAGGLVRDAAAQVADCEMALRLAEERLHPDDLQHAPIQVRLARLERRLGEALEDYRTALRIERLGRHSNDDAARAPSGSAGIAVDQRCREEC